ncbi:MAG TPA: hypothetical protein VGN37_18960 [Actinocatenispora sp.]
MTAQQTKTASRNRSTRMAPAAPHHRGGTAATPYASRRSLEFSAGGFIWR